MQPGSLTSFVDSMHSEVILRVHVDGHGQSMFGFTLYDASGGLVADAPDLKPYPQGVTIATDAGEVLLSVSGDAESKVSYRLYNHTGVLLTESDGSRTRIYGYLKMDGNKPGINRMKRSVTTEQ